MPQLPRRFLEGTVPVDGIDFNWRIHREPQWCTADGWRGLAISVAPVVDPCRELILQFAFERKSHRSTPYRQRPKISEKEIQDYIRRALTEGWNPQSRGKAFVFEISDSFSK
jgi:hypothetical protein